jgi:ABC-type transporter Mla subunit MlaD
MSQDTVHILVVAAVLLLAPMFFLVFLTGDARTGSAQEYALEDRYNRIDGVTNGTDVLLTGAPVGKVRRHEFEPQGSLGKVIFLVTDTGS